MPRTLHTTVDFCPAVPLAGPGSPTIDLDLQVTVSAERGSAADVEDIHLRQQDWNRLTRQYDETIFPFPADDWSQGLKARAIKALYASKTFPLDAADALEEAAIGEREAVAVSRAEARRDDEMLDRIHGRAAAE